MKIREGKQIKDRFINHLNKNINRHKLSTQDNLIIKWYKIYGNIWSELSKKLQERAPDMIKNRFYSFSKLLKKKNKKIKIWTKTMAYTKINKIFN